MKRSIVAAAGLVVFAVAAWFVSTGEILAFDTVTREWFYSLRNDTLTLILKIITYMGNWQFIAALCILLLFFKGTRGRYGFPVSLTAILVTILNKGIKGIFERPRPAADLHLIEQGGYAFTSGHSITSMAVFGLLICLVRKYVKDRRKANFLTVLLSIPMIFIGLSRIYLGVHFPTDVLGGWALGIVVVVAAVTIEDKRTEKLPRL